MLRRMILAVLLVASPAIANAGPKEDAEAVFQQFLTAFTAANVEGVLDVFWPDALFWGTTLPVLATSPEAVRAYFAPMVGQAPNARVATALETSTIVVSDNVVLISGTWQVHTVGTGTRTPLRVSVAVTRRGDAWRVAQFHNSPQPVR